jgi:hypothetical protein
MPHHLGSLRSFLDRKRHEFSLRLKHKHLTEILRERNVKNKDLMKPSLAAVLEDCCCAEGRKLEHEYISIRFLDVLGRPGLLRDEESEIYSESSLVKLTLRDLASPPWFDALSHSPFLPFMKTCECNSYDCQIRTIMTRRMSRRVGFDKMIVSGGKSRDAAIILLEAGAAVK